MEYVPLWQLLLTVVVQISGIIWWASGLTRRVKTLEGTLHSREIFIERFLKTEGRVESLEEQIATMKDEIDRRLDRIERKLDQVLDGRRGDNGR